MTMTVGLVLSDPSARVLERLAEITSPANAGDIKLWLDAAIAYNTGTTQAVEGDTRHAWVFRVTGIKKEWIVAALMTVRGPKFRILKKIPWQWWAGRLGGLTSGDDPIIYTMRYLNATKTKADADKTGELREENEQA